MTTIYYVEDDPLIRQAVLYALESTGFQAQGFDDGQALLAKLSSEVPDLILLDIMLPGEDGIKILRRLRSNQLTREIPIILITAKGAEIERIAGLDSGADDYVAKPFGVMELISRIKAILRRVSKKTTDEITIDPVTLDLQQHLVTIEGKTIDLTKKEFDLLHCLMKNQGRVFTRDELLNLIWGYDSEGESRTVDVHIGSIRQKLGNASGIIKTVRGVGYCSTRKGEPQ